MALNIYLPIAGVAVNALTVIGAGGAVGFLSGLFGVGGGFIITPLLMFLGIPTLVAIASGANQATATAVSGAMAHWQRGNIDFKMGALLLLGGMAGSLAGTQLVGLLRAAGQFELFVSLSYIVLLGSIGTLMLVESVK
ncbi:MAG: sulfite exporter TauE/SafE family protein, partial [Hyphomicrobiaceae bacterium]